jgi:hypothetical protein
VEILDHKQQTCSPNIFCCNDRNSSPFWKRVMWATRAAKMVYRWNIGDGYQWFGSYSLAIQFYEVYSIINEQVCAVREAWDGENLKFTFRRMVDNRIMNQWHELVQIASSI